MKHFIPAAAGAIAMALAAVSGGRALGQEFPAKPIRVISGWAPGGPTDVVARIIFNDLAKKLGQSIVVDTRPGAGGTIGSTQAAAADPDGYTLLYGTATVATMPDLYNRPDLIPDKAFEAISCTVKVPLALLVGSDFPARTAQEFVQLVKANPGKYFQGSSGGGSPDHLAGVLFAKELGLRYTHVPYKGNAGALTDLIAGNISFMFAGALQAAKPMIEAGKVRALAVSTAKRSAVLPDVPTVSETVAKGFDIGTWQVLMAPKGTPKAIIDRINGAMNEVLADPKIQQTLIERQGAETMGGSPQQCTAFVNGEHRRWSELIRANHLTAE
ncbi:tripartite tricarboxylate transporter substrate binding protein [Pigmentiphaga soli]|uniref:Tripartite tricarboxylate transporter substrate binding protein n=1 Tax=Pigmentiphaga soli TaxID=1007095 RepID=A0ABP8HEW0_9BURK